MSRECPCGCGEVVPKRSSSIWRMKHPYWEWLCPNMKCKVHQQRMLNQSGDSICSWCGRERAFVGHFTAGGAKDANLRTMVSGKVVRHRTLHGLIRRTPKHLIRPFQDVT